MTFSAKDYASKAEYEAEIVERCKALGVELICLAGYMRLVGETLMGAYEGRMINIHPSLLPSFAGKDAVERAMEWGVKVYGATIHYVDSTLDGGKIIAQRAIPYEGDSIDELMAMIHPLEHQLYIDTIKKLIKQTK
jgi:phosphoribosylglycinamide formyltransferase-1